MKKNIYLNPLTYDIKIENQTLKLTSTAIEFLAQKVENRLKLIKGEIFANQKKGIPYFTEIFNKKIKNIKQVSSIFRNELLKIIEVKEIINFTVNYENNTRKFIINYTILGNKDKDAIINGSINI